MKFIIEDLTIEEVNIILGGLSELPVKVSMPLIEKIKTACNTQFSNKKPEIAPETPEIKEIGE